MIRVNLLEVREERRRIALRNLGIFSVIALLSTGGFLFTWHSGVVNEIAEVQTSITTINQEIAQLEKIVGEVEKIKGKKKDLEKKLQVIRSLEADRAEIVDLLLAISEVLSDEVWLTSLDVAQRSINFTAQSVDMQSIGVLVKKMKADGRFTNPRTKDIKVAKGKGTGFVGFKMSASFIPPQAVDEGEQ